MRKGGGTYKLGSPYKVAGRWYVPAEDPHYDRSGVGSWYGDDFHGRKTANGEIFDMHALTAAHPTLPMPSYAFVTNLHNGRTILVRVNDRGPYVRDRVIDLSHASARALGYDSAGRANVRVRYAGRAPLNGDDRRERQYLAAQPWSRGGPVVAMDVPPPNPPQFARRAEGSWSATDYRAALTGKRPPQRFASGRESRYAVSSAELPWDDARSAPGRAGMKRDVLPDPAEAPAGGRLVWKPSPPSQPYTTSAVTEPARRSALGGGQAAYVQIGTFRDRARAEQFRGTLAHLGAVEVAPSSAAEGTLYRVRIGPMLETEARAALGEVSARGISGSRVVFE